MNEDVNTYKQRLHGYLNNQDPLEVLRQTPDRLHDLLESSNPNEIQNEPAPDRWSRAQLLMHFAEGDIVFAYRLRMIVSEPGTNIQGYDQNKWMQNATYLLQEPRKILELFRTVRNANLSYIKALPNEAWDYYGIHSERGKETIRDLVSLYAGHDLNHLRQFAQ